VHWNEYEALRDTLMKRFNAVCDSLYDDVLAVDNKLNATHDIATATQETATTIQRSIAYLTQDVNTLQASFDHPHHQQPLDHEAAASVQDDNDAHDDANAAAAAGRREGLLLGGNGGRGNGGRGVGIPPGRAFAPLGARHRFDDDFAQPANRDDDGLGKPKFTVPKFVGSTNVEEYLNWELKVEKLWHMHEYTKDRKIKLASSEFDGYALLWWDNIVQSRLEARDPPIITWRGMKEAIRAHFIPHNYIRSLYDRLTNLKQGLKSVDDYHQEMELIIQRARAHEPEEQTMQPFLVGLTYNIQRFVRHHQYFDMTNLLHQAREAELTLAEDA
jgi:hypothetical protein